MSGAWYTEPDIPSNFTAAGGGPPHSHLLAFHIPNGSAAARWILDWIIDPPAIAIAWLLGEAFALVALVGAAAVAYTLSGWLSSRLGALAGRILTIVIGVYCFTIFWRSGYYLGAILHQINAS